tara:strand:+ start:796 stop:1191 length:396 start_codon:yes stop_codon:yes gene_type:complete
MFEEILNLNTNFNTIVRKISKKYHITLSQSLILFNIPMNGTPMSKLAVRLGLDPSTVTRNIEKLEKRNLLYREKSTLDTRVINVYKSSEGNEIINDIETIVNSILIQSSENTAELKDEMQILNWNIEKEQI